MMQISKKKDLQQSQLDLAKINADIKFGEIITIGSQSIERKRNFGANQGP